MDDIQYYYCMNPKAFFSSQFPKVIEDNGLTIDDLIPIDTESYMKFINPPTGKYFVFDDSGPHLEDIPETDYVAIAKLERDRLQGIASRQITPYQTKLLLGRDLTDDEKTTFNEWLDYSDELAGLDLSSAPDISWPEQPK